MQLSFALDADKNIPLIAGTELKKTYLEKLDKMISFPMLAKLFAFRVLIMHEGFLKTYDRYIRPLYKDASVYKSFSTMIALSMEA